MSAASVAPQVPFLRAARNRWLLGLAFALLFAALILPANQHMQFWPPDSRGALLRRAALGIAFTGALTALVAFALKCVERIVAKDRRYRVWLVSAAAYTAVIIPLWVLTWPGEWVNDDFWIAHLAESWQADGWQGYLTIVLYTFAMFLYPSAIAVVLVQVVFGALVVGRFVAVIHEFSGRRRAVVVVLVPLLSPAVLVDLLYPMRLIPYAFLLLLVLTELLAMHWRLPRSVGPVGRFVGLGVAVDILATWRSEGVVLLVLLPALFIALRLHRRIKRDPKTLVATGGVVLTLVSLVGINSALSSPAYGVVATINPLAGMVSGPLRGADVQADLAAVDRVVPISALRRYPSYTDVGAYWKVGLRAGYQSHLGAYYPAVVHLVLTNPDAFLRNRWNVLLASNALDDEVPVVRPEHLRSVGYGESDFGALAAGDPIATRTDPVLRLRTLQRLFFTTPTGSITPATRVVFDDLPTLLALLVLVVVAVSRRRWFWCSVGALLVAQALLVVLTAPGALFMYFFPTYVAGTALLSAAAAAGVARAADRRAASADPVRSARTGLRGFSAPVPNRIVDPRR